MRRRTIFEKPKVYENSFITKVKGNGTSVTRLIGASALDFIDKVYIDDEEVVISDYLYVFDDTKLHTVVFQLKDDITDRECFGHFFQNTYIEYVDFNTVVIPDDCYYFYKMFESCRYLKTVKFGKNKLKMMYNAESMFEYCYELETIDMSGLQLDELYSTRRMFCGCNKLKTVKMFKNNSYLYVNMEGMFEGCTSLTSVNFNTTTSYVTNMSFMFTDCSALQTCVLTFDMTNVSSFNFMFSGCENLKELYMLGQPPTQSVDGYTFNGLSNNSGAKFYYNSSYNWSYMLEAVPSTWQKIPY